MCLVGPHDSAGNVRIMWMNLVKISPFLYDLLAQQQFKVSDRLMTSMDSET